MPASAGITSKPASARASLTARPAKSAPAQKQEPTKSAVHKSPSALPVFAHPATPAASQTSAVHTANIVTRAKIPASDSSIHKAQHKAAPKPQPPLAQLAPAKFPGAAAGQPLAPHVKEALENTFRVDLGSVRLHSDTAAQAKAQSLSARAFTYGHNIFLGKGEHPTDLALLSHEAAHVVQQQAGAHVQTWSSDRTDRFEREADQAAAAVARQESFTVRERVASPRVQRLGISDALDYFADKAYNIPGFRMFTIVLGVNPINMEHVERTPANVLRAVVEFIPGGHLITQALDKYNVFDKVGDWVQKQLDTLAMTGSSIKNAIMDFLDSLSWRDIFHLGSVWDRAKRIFTDPIDRIKDFVVGFVEGIWKFVRDAILKPIAALASKTAGWDLLCAVLGRNPITGEAVPRTAETLIGGFMKLIHEEEVWNNLQKAKAVPRAWAWFQSVLSGLLGFVTQIPDLFITALKSLSWTDVIDLPAGFIKVARVFGKFLVSFISWAGQKVWDLLQIIFEVVAPAVMPYLRKLGAAFRDILKHPLHFMHNLIAAGKLGFEQFVAKIGAHLKAAFIEWLTGSLPGVYIPKALELHEIIKFVLSVLGLTWQNIRAKLVKLLGEPTVKAMETGFDIVVTLVKEGPAAAWEKIKEELGNLKEMVMQAIMNFVIETIVKKAVAKIVSLFVPGGAFIQAIISIYDTIMVFVHKIAKIIQVMKAFLDSMMQIAKGAIGAAANKVESTLAGLLVLAINFLAGFLGLGKIADKVMDIINTKVRDPIDKALDSVAKWIATMAKKLWKGAKQVAGKIFDWWKARQPFKADDGSTHTLLFVGEGESAELAFESTPSKLESFLDGLQSPTPAQKALVQAIKAEVKTINTIRTINKPGSPDLDESTIAANKTKVAASLLRISQSLGQLVHSSSWGTKSKPLPINYPKPKASNYMKIYIGPKTENPIDQSDLKAAASNKAMLDQIKKAIAADNTALKNWEARGFNIQIFSPAVSARNPLPEGGASIGVVPEYQTRPGMAFHLQPGSTQGGRKITQALTPYGWRNAIEHTDGDHVLEMQLGGPNELDNLWPLDSAVNQNSGRTIKDMAVAKPDGTTIKMPDLKEEARRREVWLVIVQTEG